jgi:hypothetical protein
MYVVEVVGVVGLAVGTEKSLPTSKVLLLVQYVSRGPSFNQQYPAGTLGISKVPLAPAVPERDWKEPSDCGTSAAT